MGITIEDAWGHGRSSSVEAKRVALDLPPGERNCFRCGESFTAEGGDRICAACRAPKPKRTVLNPNLSFREKQVVNLICHAKMNKEIAFELHLTEGTIKEYLNRIFRKLGVSSRTELAVWALTRPKVPAVPAA